MARLGSLEEPNNRKDTRSRKAVSVSAAVASALLLAACAGGAGVGDSGDDDSGFEYGADQSTVDEAVSDLEPITVNLQVGAASERSPFAPQGTVFKEMVEERSNGKITVDIIWGQAVAGYDEVHDALTDGRVDIAFTLPAYDPSDFPVFDTLSTATAELPSSPLVGELVGNAVANEVSWNNEDLLQEYDEKGLTPLNPMLPMGGYYSLCSSPVEEVDDWQGLQARVGSATQASQLTHLGGSPVSLEFTEQYEALQRGTIDCSIAQLGTGIESGAIEVAPHIGYTTDASFARSSVAVLTGKDFFSSLPMAYQQILFDVNALAANGYLKPSIDTNAVAVQEAKANDGVILPYADEVQEEFQAYAKQLTDEAAASGLVDENISEVVRESGERWTQIFEEVGYTDEGSTEDLDEWYDLETDFEPYAVAVLEEGPAIEHRPGD